MSELLNWLFIHLGVLVLISKFYFSFRSRKSCIKTKTKQRCYVANDPAFWHVLESVLKLATTNRVKHYCSFAETVRTIDAHRQLKKSLFFFLQRCFWRFRPVKVTSFFNWCEAINAVATTSFFSSQPASDGSLVKRTLYMFLMSIECCPINALKEVFVCS